MDLLKKIEEIVKEKVPFVNNLELNTKLFSLDINSLEFILLLSEIEKQLNFEIDIENVNDFQTLTIGDIIEMAEEAK